MSNAHNRVVILSGAGLSAASGVPTFRDSNGLWEGHDIQDVATPQAWVRDSELVRTFYDERRIACASVQPNPGHLALARLQAAWGPERVVLVTQNIDGLLQQAGCEHVIEMHGSLYRLRCEHDEEHAHVPVSGAQSRTLACETCGGHMRPAVVWFGEMPNHMDLIQESTLSCGRFVCVGTSGVVYPAAGLSEMARAAGARTFEINPIPSGAPFDFIVDQAAEVALPALVEAWLQ